MVDLIVIAGAPGSGKTTVARLLHERYRSVLIDFGAFREFHLRSDWSNQSAEEETMAFENLLFTVRNYLRHGYRNVLLTDLKDRRVREIPQLFADHEYLIATLVVRDDKELTRRVLLPARDSGWRDTESALAWNRALTERPQLPGELKIDNTVPDPEPAVFAILAAARR